MMLVISVGIICFTVILLVIMVAPGLSHRRDSAAYGRDLALAKLFEARAGLMRVEEQERRDAVRRRDAGEARLETARREQRRNKPGEVRSCDARQ